MSEKRIEQYQDMLDKERPIIPGHPPLSRESRAAQFSPFAALTGYEDLIEEGARLTDSKIILGEEALEELNRSLKGLPDIVTGKEMVELVYFEKDAWKAGGAYRRYSGLIIKYDAIEEWVKLEDGTKVKFADIAGLQMVPDSSVMDVNRILR